MYGKIEIRPGNYYGVRGAEVILLELPNSKHRVIILKKGRYAEIVVADELMEDTKAFAGYIKYLAEDLDPPYEEFPGRTQHGPPEESILSAPKFKTEWPK